MIRREPSSSLVQLGVVVDYVPWPAAGCSLAQARERTAERPVWRRRAELLSRRVDGELDTTESEVEAELLEIEAETSATCLGHLKSRRLVAYGHPILSSPVTELISHEYWSVATAIDWKTSATADNRAGRVQWHDVRVVPPLLAPCGATLLDGLPLIEAFRQCVLGDPEVASLGREAVRLSPKFASVFFEGRHYVHGFEEWPLAFERWETKITLHPDPAKRSKYDHGGPPDPIEAVIAAEARLHRYCLLVTLLRKGELEGRASPGTAGPVEQIPRAIWFHRDFSFDPSTGDILQDNPHSTANHDRHVRRWVGVVLQKGTTARSDESGLPSHVKPFTAGEVIALGSLTEALARLVFRHPAVRALYRLATAAAGTKNAIVEEDAGLVGLVLGHDEPLLPLRYFARVTDGSEALIPVCPPEEAATWDEALDVPWPTEVQAYYDAVNLRARTLIEMLQGQEIVTRGHVADGHLVQIAHTIWSHEEYYIHPPTGDVYEADYEGMIRKWIGVVFEAGIPAQHSAMFHGKPTGHDQPRSIATEPSTGVTRKGVARVEASIKDATQCREWLADLMRKDPHGRVTNADLWHEAKQRWPRLSKNAFLTAKAQAIEETGAYEWGLGGAPKNRRTESPN